MFRTIHRAITKLSKKKNEKNLNLRVAELHEVVPRLFQYHNDAHLHAEVNQAATGMALQQQQKHIRSAITKKNNKKTPEH